MTNIFESKSQPFREIEIIDNQLLLKISTLNSSLEIETPLRLDNSLNEYDYVCFYFSKLDLKENQIYQAWSERDERIGWMIPVNALCSNNHDYAQDEHFLRHAAVALKNSVLDINDEVFHQPVGTERASFSISEVLHESTSILILKKDYITNQRFGKNLCTHTASLWKYGYFELSSTNPESLTISCPSPEGKKLKIRKISENIDNKEIISEIINKQAAFEKNPAFRFFFIYQVIELLIDQVHQIEQKKILDEISTAKPNSSETKEILAKLNDISSEKRQINLLINNYSKCAGDLGNLKFSCNAFLDSIKKNKGHSFENFFYPVRNYIIHQMRDIPGESFEKISYIVADFLTSLPSILSRFDE